MIIEDIRKLLENDLIKQLNYDGMKPSLKASNKLIINKIKSVNIPLSISEIFYLLRHKDNLENLHIFCPICGNKNKFNCLSMGYFKHCSNECKGKDKNLIQIIINSNKNNIDENGLNGYQRGARKAALIKKCKIDEDGLNIYQRANKKAEQTTYAKTGFKYISQTQEWKEKIRSIKDQILKNSGDTCEIRYGNRIYAKSEHRFLLDPNHKNFEDINEEFFRNNFIINGLFDVEKCMIHFGTSVSWVMNHKNKFNIIEKNLKNNSSKPQREVYNFIKSIYKQEIQYNTKKILKERELDIYLPDVNLAIEFNGIYWHSLKVGKDKYYHQNKLKACLVKGIRLIHVWEDEWNDNRKQEIIKNNIKRAIGLDIKTVENIKIDEISEVQYEEFCNEYNLEGYKKADIKLGLFDNDKLIQVLSLTLKEQSYTIIANCYNFDLYKDYTKELIEYFHQNYNKRNLHIVFNLNIDKDEIQIYLNCGFKIIALLDPRKRKLENYTVFDSGVFTLFI